MKYTYNLFIGGCALLVIVLIFLKYFIYIDNLRQHARIVPINIVRQTNSPPPRYETMPITPLSIPIPPTIDSSGCRRTTINELNHISPPPDYNYNRQGNLIL